MAGNSDEPCFGDSSAATDQVGCARIASGEIDCEENLEDAERLR
jgi:hypothetical protein